MYDYCATYNDFKREADAILAVLGCYVVAVHTRQSIS